MKMLDLMHFIPEKLEPSMFSLVKLANNPKQTSQQLGHAENWMVRLKKIKSLSIIRTKNIQP